MTTAHETSRKSKRHAGRHEQLKSSGFGSLGSPWSKEVKGAQLQIRNGGLHIAIAPRKLLNRNH
eukprot:2790066-Amphidinium_carterae.1